MAKWQAIAALPDGESRRVALNAYVVGLLTEAGVAPGLVGDGTIRVPLVYLNQLIVAASQGIASTGALNAGAAALRQQPRK
jgi:hypothetical protein